MKDFTRFLEEENNKFVIKNKIITVNKGYKNVLKVMGVVKKGIKTTENADNLEEAFKLLIGDKQYKELLSLNPSFELMSELFAHAIELATGQGEKTQNPSG